MSIGMEICKFFRNNAELKQVGQGTITISCNKLWDMSDSDFTEKFLGYNKELVDKWFNKCVLLQGIENNEMKLLIADSKKAFEDGYNKAKEELTTTAKDTKTSEDNK